MKNRRVFKQVGDGYEWCHYHDWRVQNERARRYGWQGKELPDCMRSA